MKKSAILFSLLFSIFLLNSSVLGQVSITATNTPVTQNFDVMGTGNFNLTDNSSIAGVYAFRQNGNVTPNVFTADNGGSNAGRFNNYGTTAASDRALGSASSGTPLTLRYGVRYINNTGAPITSLTVSYTGEQWRNGGNTTAQSLTFDYRQAATVTDLTTGTYTSVAELSFTSLQNTATAAALDGNNAANRTQLSQTINVTIPAGEEIMIRWTDVNDAGNDHGFGIDDLSVTAAGAPAADIDLTIARETFDTSVDAGNTVEFTLTVSNSGTTTATNVGATFSVPNGLTYSNASVNGGFAASQSGGVVTFSGGTVGAGSSVTLTVSATANTAGTIVTSSGAQTVVDPNNTITETNETNNVAVNDVEIRVRFQSPVVGLNGRPSLAQLLAEVDDIGISRDFNFENIVRLDQNLTDENTDIVVPTDVYLDFSIYTISGTANITFGNAPPFQLGNGNGAGFKTSNSNGLGDATHPGSIQLSGTRTFNGATDATFYITLNNTFNGVPVQNAYGMPVLIDQFEIRNPFGVNIFAPFEISGDLNLVNGIINNGENTITLAPFARNNGDNNGQGNANSYVSGAIEKRIPFFGEAQLGIIPCYTFPVGTVGGEQSGYSPMRMCWDSVNANSSLKARAFDTNSPAVSTPSLSRYWQLDEIGDFEADLQFFWVEGDEAAIANAPDLRIFRGSLSVCTTANNCTVDLTANTATINNVTNFSPWTVAEFVPSAANVEVSGRVVDANGNGIANVIVSYTDQNGAVRSVRTNSFGNYRVEGLEAGRTYVFNATSRRNRFTSQVVTPQENVADLNFTAID